MENALAGKPPSKATKAKNRLKKDQESEQQYTVEPRDPVEIVKEVLKNCKRKRDELKANNDQSVTDYTLSQLSRFTDKFDLKPYASFLQYVPRLVNVVTVRSFQTHALPHSLILRSSGVSTLSLRSWQRLFLSRGPESNFPWIFD